MSRRIEHRAGTMVALSPLADDHMPWGLGRKSNKLHKSTRAYISAPYGRADCMLSEIRSRPDISILLLENFLNQNEMTSFLRLSSTFDICGDFLLLIECFVTSYGMRFMAFDAFADRADLAAEADLEAGAVESDR